MDTSDLTGMADYQLIGYHSGYGNAPGQPTGQSGQQSAGLPVGANNMPASIGGLPGQGSTQAYHQLQSQHPPRAGYPQTNDPLMSHKMHSQYPNYGSAGSAVQGMNVRGQYPTDPRYAQHGIDYNSAMSQSHLTQSTQPSIPSSYGQQNMMGQYAGQRMHAPGLTPSRQPTGPLHGMSSHYNSSYPAGSTQSGYHPHSTPSSDMWPGQGVSHMQQSSSYPGYPGSGASGPSQGVPHSRAAQNQYMSHSEYSAMHPNDQQRQYFSSSGGQTQSQSMPSHITGESSTLSYPTPSQGPYNSTPGSQLPPTASTRGSHSAISGSVPRQQYMGYTTPQPSSQQTQPQSTGASIQRYPQQYSGYPQTGGFGETAQSRLSPYPLSQSGPAGPNSPQFRPGFPASTGSQLSSLSPRRPTTTPPAGSPMPPSSHTPDRSSANTTPQASTHHPSFPISPGANHLSSPGQGLSPGSSVPSTPSSLQQLEQMVMPHLGGVGSVNSSSKTSIPVSTNSSASSSTPSFYGSVGRMTTDSSSTGAAPLSPQASQGIYPHYPSPGNMTSNKSQYPYHQYQQNNSHWTGPQPSPISSAATSAATSITNTHSMGGVGGGGIPLQPQSSMASMGQTSQSSTHQNSPSLASNNSSSPNVSKSDVSMPVNSGISGQYNSYGSELNASATDSNFSQTFSSRSTSLNNSTPPSSTSSSSSSQPLQSGYSVSQSTGSTSASFDSSVMKAQHNKQQVQQSVQGSQAAQNDTQQSQQQQQQTQSQTPGATMASPTHMFDSIKSPNASTPRPMSDTLNNDLQPNSQSQSDSQSAAQTTQQMMGPGVPPHHSYHPMMHQQPVHHQSYPPQPQMANYQNSYDGMNYDINNMNSVTGDMSQSSSMNSGPYGDHDSMMYDNYGMDNMVPQQMGDYHRDQSGGDYGQIDPYSANFDDSFGEPPTKRKGKGRPKKDPNEPKKERKPRQPRAPRGTGRGRGRGSKANNNMSDRLAAMPPMMPPEYDPNFGMPPENMDMYGHDMYSQPMPPTQQSAIPSQQSQIMSSMSGPMQPSPQHQQSLQPQQAPPPPAPPQQPHGSQSESSQSPPQQQQQQPPPPQTNHCQQPTPIQQSIPTILQSQSPNEAEIASPVPSLPPHSYTPPIPPPLMPSEQPIQPIIEKPIETEQNLYDESFLEQSTTSETTNINDTTLVSMTSEEEQNVSLAVPTDGDMFSDPPRQVSPCPPPNTDQEIPETKMDSYEFAVDDSQLMSTPVKTPKEKKPKKRKPKKEPTEQPEGETSVEINAENEAKPPKPKKAKKKKPKKTVPIETEEPVDVEVKDTPTEEANDSQTAVTTDMDDATQESSQCDSSAIESSASKGKKKKSSSKSNSKPRIKNKSPKKKLPKLALKFSKNKKRRRFGSGSDHSDLEKTPPPSPDDTESGLQKRRSARNTKRQKYTDDIDLDLSDDDNPLQTKDSVDNTGKPLTDGNVSSVVISEDTMVVEKIMSSRMGTRELEDEGNETTVVDPNAKPQTIEVEEFFVKYKNLSFLHCEWKTEEELERGDRRVGQKLKRFKQKKDTMNMFDFLDEEPYNPDYVEVDRILDVNEIEEIIEVIPEDKEKEKENEIEKEKDVEKEKNVEKDEEKDVENDEEKDMEKDVEKDIEKEKDVEKEEEMEIEKCEPKDETEIDSQSSDLATIETDKTDPNSAESSIVPNDSEKTETDSNSDNNENKIKTEDLAEQSTNDEKSIDSTITKNNDKTDDESTQESEIKSDETADKSDVKVEETVNAEDVSKTEKLEEAKEDKPKPIIKTRKVKHYLVKWRALAYEDSTWELEDDLDQQKIEHFYRFRKPPPKSEWKPKKRPKPADWKKIEESPLYKGVNTLREYQLEGLNWLSFCWHNNQNCILADEMGLGKTIQSLAFVNEMTNHGINGPFLVIAPLSTIGNWQREFETWTDLNVITYHGSSASRNMLQEYEMYYKNDKYERISGIYKFQVMITTFEIVLTDCLELREIHWKSCIIDEAHRLKNRNCKLLEGLRLLDVEHRVLLTGTPLQNNVEELFSLLNFLEPTQFTSNESFMLEFGDLKTEAQVDKLKAILKPMMLRRLKEDVEKTLAPKEETIVEVELTNIQKKYYRAILERNFQFLSKGGSYTNMPNLMNTMMELRKCCIHPFLLNGAEEHIFYEYREQHGKEGGDTTLNAIVNASGKLVLIDKLLPRLKENGHRVLIFSQMVRCLDILEDYLVHKRYPYERIDGRVRGNLRQAAIDRYCKPDSDRFVFLLCTRAGGLGINLTAADTVIIFDSDWNPQNDLQAQARCHRIGQSKAVKVYRLICRNTYEREMFDKASLKLGLDRAVLQSINSSKANLNDNQLSKKEIEDLLRKGAYGALMDDDNAGDTFCEEDIDHILQRRTQTIIIESEGKGSTFSKASFASSNNRSDIEIDDPNFWEKWAKKANFDIDELKGRNELIVQEPRRRTQTKRFGADDAVLDMSELESSDEDEDSVSTRTRGGKQRLPKGKKGKKGRGGGYERERDEDYMQEFGPGNWTRAECYKVEKGLLTFGWGRWAECLILGNFRRQLTRMDVESISRVLLLYSLQNYKGDEKIKSFIWDLITPAEDGEQHRIHRNHTGLSAPVPRGRKNKKLKKTVGEELESSDWAKDEKFNPDVLLTDDQYRKHLLRHANKILLRVRLLYYLKHEIIGPYHEQVFAGVPARDIPIPPPVADGDPPAQWWDEEADKSLLVGVYKHGYDRFNLMRQDPALCFLSRCGPPDGAALLAEMNADEDLGKTLEEDDEPETPATPATPVSETDGPTKTKIEKSDSKDDDLNDGNNTLLPFPSSADMNHRLRRTVTSYQRHFKKQEMKIAQRARHQQRLERLERFEAAIKEREVKKRDLAQKKWSRREEADFYRVVSSFGVEYNRETDTYDWTRFRSFGKLERKLDDTLTEYFKAFYAMCKRVTGRRLSEEEENLPISVDPISEERASRCTARIDLLSKIREEIVTHPELEERLQLCQHSMDLPEWWVSGRHDKDLLLGAAKYGLNRLDFNLTNDPEMSFMEVFAKLDAIEEKARSDALSEEKLEDKIQIETKAEVSEVDKEVKTKEEDVTEEVADKSDIKNTEEKIDEELVDKKEENPEVSDEKTVDNENKIEDESVNFKDVEEKSENMDEIKDDIKDEKKEVEKQKEELANSPKPESQSEDKIIENNVDNESKEKSIEPEAKEDIKETTDEKMETDNNETKPDETKPDETKSDETKSDETKSDETKSDETKSDETINKDELPIEPVVLPKVEKHEKTQENCKENEIEEKMETNETEKTEDEVKTHTEKMDVDSEEKVVIEDIETKKETEEVDKEEEEDIKNKDENKNENLEEVKEEETKLKEEPKEVAVEEVKSEETTDKENSEIKTESETASIATEKETSITASSTPQPQNVQQKSFNRFPKDRVLQMRLEQICHVVEKNEWPSLRHTFFSLMSCPHQSTPSVATADSSPRPLSPGSLSSASREPTPHPTPDHTPRREALSPLPEFFYADNSASINESASHRRRRRRRRFEVEAERQKLRNLLSQTIEQQQQQQHHHHQQQHTPQPQQQLQQQQQQHQSSSSSKKQTSLLSNNASQFFPPLFSLPFGNLRSAIRDELLTDEKTASLLLGSTLQSSLAAAAAQSAAQSVAQSSTTSATPTSKGPPPAHQQNSSKFTNSTLGTLDLTGRFKSTPKMTSAPVPAHKVAPVENRKTAAQDVLDLSSAPVKRTRSNISDKKQMATDSSAVPLALSTSSSKRSSRKIGSRIDALALNLQAKKMMEEKQSDPKPEKQESVLSSFEKTRQQQTHFLDELNKHSQMLASKTPPAAHAKSSSSMSSKHLNESLLANKLSAHLGSLDTSKLPPSKANEASTIAEQVAIIRQNLRNLFEDHPEFIAQNPNMASMVAASAANVFNPNLNVNNLSTIAANTELLELPDSRRSRSSSRRSRVDPSQLDLQNLTGEENVSVINRTTGKKITGSKAPPLKHLAEWLDKNPKFDVDPKWSPLVNKEKAATFKTPTSIPNVGVRTRTSDKRSSSSSSSANSSLTALANNLLNSASANLSSGSNSNNNSSSSSRRSTAASLLASGYGNAFGNTAVTSSGLSYPSSALNSFNAASMLAAGFPSMKMFMDQTSGSTTATSLTTNSHSKSTLSSTSSTNTSTTPTTSASNAPPLFFPFGGLGMGLTNPLFGFPNFNIPGLTPTSNAMTGLSSSDKKDSSDTPSNEKTKSGKSSNSSKNKSGINSSSFLGSSAAASALGSGALPFLYPPNFLYNPLSLSGFSGLSGSPFGIPGLMNGLGGLSTTAMSGFNTNTTNSLASQMKAKTSTSSSSRTPKHSSSISSAPSGLSLASSLLASAGVHPSSAAAAAAIGDSDDDSLKSLMGNDDDDDLNGDYDDNNMNDIKDSDYELESKSASKRKTSSVNKSSSKDLSKHKTKGNSNSTSKVSPK
ncbi:chromodomain-helicase-DNA-binding protein 7-like isoform X2 [Oppia nitens]|uniref:chromodomain-helicase-DNA-binding protein 7-like isoform X2 n=1 Tax=Oppia nitens TaxID=1686743 RepID=UPI0023DC3774|nr:chromodomain-helicase-DNA-binding protein 7-like isoform X2 [Oppia nitens]